MIPIMRVSRRYAIQKLAGAFGAAPFCDLLGRARADTAADVLGPVTVMDFAALAKAKLDPLAWDYLDGGSEDEVALRDNRAAFNRIILRPRALVDVHKIDMSLELFGIKLDYPILLDPAGGKNCFFRDGENTVA